MSHGGGDSWLRFAQWAGVHALPGFLLALAAVMALSWLGWQLLRRVAWHSPASSLPPGAFLLLRLGLGFVIVLACAAVFTEIAEELGDGERLGALDQAFTDALASSVPLLALEAFARVTRLGDAWTQTGICIVVALVLLWLRRWWLALGWVVAVAGNGLLNTTLKGIFARVRPLHDHGLVLADGWSFPSGHSSGSVVVWGMLAYLLVRSLPMRWHAPAVMAAAGLAFTTGCSRVFLQVHFASDVLAGFASGTAWLLVCVVSIEMTRHYRRRAGKGAAVA